MAGISLVTKGMLCPPSQVNIVMQSGSGGAGFRREEKEQKPLIRVTNLKIGEGKQTLTGENIKVKSVKIILD